MGIKVHKSGKTLMGFDEIGQELGITAAEAKKAFDTGIRKLKNPKLIRPLLSYVNIAETMPMSSDHYGMEF